MYDGEKKEWTYGGIQKKNKNESRAKQGGTRTYKKAWLKITIKNTGRGKRSLE